ncbi:membrane dipeptidase [Nitrosomonas sp.]|uniref:membrane dipeptidase n=1 Tax=Nitrosomonas sp. TaxID=42353 RepID=UPI0037C8464C
MAGVSNIRNVTAELIQRSYSDTDIEKLWDGNFLHIWKESRTLVAPTSNQACQTLRYERA